MTRARMGSISSGLDAAKPIETSRMPRATALAPIASRLVMRPSTRAASARSSTPTVSAPNTGQAEDAGPQEDGSEGEQRGDRPDQRLQPLDRHAEQRRTIGAVGAGADRDPDAAQPQEQREADERERRHDHRDEVVGVEDDGADRELEVERRGEPLAEQREVDAPEPRQQDRERGEQLRQAERRDRDQQPRRLEEAADDRELDDRPDRESGEDPDRHSDEVGPAPRGHQHHDQHDGDGPHVGLGEVDEAVRPVRQRHAERDQRGEEADQDPADEDAERDPEEDLLDDEDAERGQIRRRAVEVEARPRARPRLLPTFRGYRGHEPPTAPAVTGRDPPCFCSTPRSMVSVKIAGSTPGHRPRDSLVTDRDPFAALGPSRTWA